MNYNDPEVKSVLLSNVFPGLFSVFAPATVTQNTTASLGLVTTLLLSLLLHIETVTHAKAIRQIGHLDSEIIKIS